MKSKARSRCSDNLLLFRTSELAQNSFCDGGRRLNRQRVHKHRRRSRHLDLGLGVGVAVCAGGRCNFSKVLCSSSDTPDINGEGEDVHNGR